MARISDEKIEQIVSLYAKYHTYAQVAREVGCSASTVKKYVTECGPTTITADTHKFNEDIKPIQEVELPMRQSELIRLGGLTNAERLEIQELWKEIQA